MKCPWLVKTVIQTNNKNSFNDSVRTEHQEFDNCMRNECPYYYTTNNNQNTKCLRVEIDKANSQLLI